MVVHKSSSVPHLHHSIDTIDSVPGYGVYSIYDHSLHTLQFFACAEIPVLKFKTLAPLYTRNLCNYKVVGMSIPIIDVVYLAKGEQTEVSEHIGTACHDWGVFYIKNHGIQVENLMFEMRNFFNATVEQKQKAVPKSGYFGYFHKGGESTVGKKDCKEGLYLRAEYPNVKEQISDNDIMRCANHWPNSEKFPNYKEVVSEYLQATRQVVFKLAECLAICLGLERSHFNERLTERPFQQIGLFRYLLSDDGDGELYQWGVGPHCDTGFLTVLLQDTVG